MPDLEPITREEMFLDGQDLEPITREEMFIKRIYDKTQEVPTPLTRKEMFLLKASEGGGGGDVKVEPLTVTENGTYSEEGKAYSPVIVNVQGGGKVTIPFTQLGDLYHEGNIDAIATDNHIISQYEIGVYCGLSFNGTLDLTDLGYSKMKYKIITKECYDSLNGQNIRPLIVGISEYQYDSYVYASQTTAPRYYKNGKYNVYDVNYINSTIEGEIDLSDLTGTNYLLIVATGWTMEVVELTFS